MQRDAEGGELLTVRELAREWKQNESTIYRKVERGLIPSVRLGDQTSALRIPRAELQRSMHRDLGASSAPPLGRPEPSERRGSNSVGRPAVARGGDAA